MVIFKKVVIQKGCEEVMPNQVRIINVVFNNYHERMNAI